jgi:hypothetical protein
VRAESDSRAGGQSNTTMMTTIFLVLNIMLLLCSKAVRYQQSSAAYSRAAMCLQGTTSSEPTSPSSRATKGLLLAGRAGLFAAALFSAQSASAKVFFDTDVYGDKELKIATVNKVLHGYYNAAQ